jgi:alkylation response protein AidB-like acyl-CoA dehydrogenase
MKGSTHNKQPGFMAELFLGRLRCDLLQPFPEQSPEEQAAGDAIVASISEFLQEHVNPTRVDETRQLPDGLLGQLQERGYMRFAVEQRLGGLGLSAYNTFRAIQTAATWSPPVAVVMALSNGLGSAAYLPLLPPGPLKDMISERVAKGIVSGGADTEPSGAANRLRMTTATPVENGAAFLLNGEKVYIGNGPVAELIDVSATLREDGQEQVRLFFIDTRSPGFQVAEGHEFLGMRGLPNSRLLLHNVRVPREHMMTGDEDSWRLSPEILVMAATARIYLIAAPSLAIAKLSTQWSRDFLLRRTVDGRPLGEYDQIQRMVAESLAETFAIESVVAWALLGSERVDTRYERVAAKNITSLTSWRIIDRTLSLLGAEGFETGPSKTRRGVPGLPVERFLRDARGLRVSGGVDFQLDFWAAQGGLLACYYPADGRMPELAKARPTPSMPGLDARNSEHLAYVDSHTARLARTCMELARRYPDPEALYARGAVVVALGQLTRELFTMAVVLARAAHLARKGQAEAGDLADIYCCAARHRIEDSWRSLSADPEPDYAGVSRRWLARLAYSSLERDLLSKVPGLA